MQASFRSRGRRPHLLLAPILLIAGALALAGCQMLRNMSPATRKAEEVSARLLQLQARNMRFADDYVGLLMQAVRQLERPSTDPEERYQLSGWILAQANSAYINASGDNSVIGTLDLITLATLSRMVIESTSQARFPDAAGDLLRVHRELEAAAWHLADGVLTPAEQSDLRKLLLEWRAQNPDVHNAPFIRFQKFVSAVQVQPAQGKTLLPTSLMGVVGLDPMAGLDPAVRQVEQSRLLAERAIYYAQRVPILIDLQLDRSLNRVAAGPESQKLQRQTASLASSAERFSTATEALPDAFAREREALINQLSAMLTAQQQTLTPMLIELRGALEAGNTTATSVDQAVRSIDTLVARFAHKPGEPRGKPFDVNEYTQAAAEITRAAGELQRLLGSAGTRAPQVGNALEAGATQGRALVDYFFVRVAWLIALLCIGLLATLLLYRWLSPRIRTS